MRRPALPPGGAHQRTAHRPGLGGARPRPEAPIRNLRWPCPDPARRRRTTRPRRRPSSRRGARRAAPPRRVALMDPISFLIDPMAYGFMQRGLLAALLVGVVCAVMGTFAVLKGLAFIGDGVTPA